MEFIVSIFSFNEKKNNIAELLYFIRKKSKLGLKIEYVDGDKKDKDLVLKMTQKADGHELSIYSQDIEEILARVDSYNKDFMQVNFKNKNPILITEQFIGFNPVGKHVEGLPEVVTTVDLKEVYKVTFDLLHLSGSEEAISWSEVEKLKDMFFAIAAGGIAVGFELQMEKEEFQYLMMSHREAVNA